MFIRILILFITLMIFLAPVTQAKTYTLKDKVKMMFTTNTNKKKPVEVKTIPAGAVCSPDVPADCGKK